MPTERQDITESDILMEDATPHFFPTPEDLRAWFEANHDKVDVMWVGYYKKATKLPTATVAITVRKVGLGLIAPGSWQGNWDGSGSVCPFRPDSQQVVDRLGAS